MNLSYRAHVQNIGWQEWVSEGEVAGTTGQSLRMEAIQIQLSGVPDGMHLRYKAHVQNIGWQEWVSEGEVAGTTGQSLRMEALHIELITSTPPLSFIVVYQAHVQNIGWQNWVPQGEIAGTTGQSLRMEAVSIVLQPVDAVMNSLQQATLAYYPLRNDTLDQSANHLDGMASPQVSYGPGKWGQAADFTTPGAGIRLPLAVSRPFTISAWVYLKAGGPRQNVPFAPILGPLQVNQIDGSVLFQLISDLGEVHLQAQRKLGQNQWHHLLVSCELAQVVLYIDGQLDTAQSMPPALAGFDTFPITSLSLVGGASSLENSDLISTLYGQISDLYVLKGAVNQTEIAYLAGIQTQPVGGPFSPLQKRNVAAVLAVAVSAFLIGVYVATRFLPQVEEISSEREPPQPQPSAPTPLMLSESPALVTVPDQAGYESLYCLYQGYKESGVLSSTIFDGAAWTPGLPLKDPAGQQIGMSGSPALALFRQKLYCLYQGYGQNGLLFSTSFDGSNWAAIQQVKDTTGQAIGMSGSPALVVFQEKLYCLYQGYGQNGLLFYTSFDGASWAPIQQVKDAAGQAVGMSESPALAVFLDGTSKERLYCLYQRYGKSGVLSITSFDGSTWTTGQPVKDPAGQQIGMSGSPALAVFEGKLYCAYQGYGENGLLFYTSFDGASWAAIQQVKEPTGRAVGMSASPALAVFGKLYCVYQGYGASGTAHYICFDGSTWTLESTLSLYHPIDAPRIEEGYFSQLFENAALGPFLEAELLAGAGKGKLRVRYNWLSSALYCDPNDTSPFVWLFTKRDEKTLLLSPKQGYNAMTLYVALSSSGYMQVQDGGWSTAVLPQTLLETGSTGIFTVTFKGSNGHYLAVSPTLSTENNLFGYRIKSDHTLLDEQCTFLLSNIRLTQAAMAPMTRYAIAKEDIQAVVDAYGFPLSASEIAGLQQLFPPLTPELLALSANQRTQKRFMTMREWTTVGGLVGALLGYEIGNLLAGDLGAAVGSHLLGSLGQGTGLSVGISLQMYDPHEDPTNVINTGNPSIARTLVTIIPAAGPYTNKSLFMDLTHLHYYPRIGDPDLPYAGCLYPPDANGKAQVWFPVPGEVRPFLIDGARWPGARVGPQNPWDEDDRQSPLVYMAIFVIVQIQNGKFQLRLHPDQYGQAPGRPNHTQLTQGSRLLALVGYDQMRVYAAGELYCLEDRTIKMISPKTGHYNNRSLEFNSEIYTTTSRLLQALGYSLDGIIYYYA